MLRPVGRCGPQRPLFRRRRLLRRPGPARCFGCGCAARCCGVSVREKGSAATHRAFHSALTDTPKHLSPPHFSISAFSISAFSISAFSFPLSALPHTPLTTNALRALFSGFQLSAFCFQLYLLHLFSPFCKNFLCSPPRMRFVLHETNESAGVLSRKCVSTPVEKPENIHPPLNPNPLIPNPQSTLS